MKVADLVAGPRARVTLLVAAASLTALGLVMIYSASSVPDYVKLGDSAFSLKRQAVGLAIGVLLLVGLDWFDYRRLKRMAWGLWGLSVAALVSVQIWGITVNGAKSWLSIGGQRIQPSEYAKLACVLVFASVLADRLAGRLSERKTVRSLLLATVPVLGLVLLQGDMGTAMTIAIPLYLVLVVAGLPGGQLVGIGVSGVGLALLGMFAEPYRAARFFSFLDPWADPQRSGYQLIQGLLAFGDGGVTGVGLGLSRQKFFYLPAAHTDFIYAIVGEELGLLGTLGVLAGFAAFTYAGFRIAASSKDHFGRIAAAGLTGVIVAQALVNMMAVTKLMPLTGVPLPFVSFGGSSLTLTLACVGVIASVGRGTRLRGVSARGALLAKGGGRGEGVADGRGDGGSRLPRAGGGGRTVRSRA